MYLSDRVYSLGIDEAGQFVEFALLAFFRSGTFWCSQC